MIKCEHCGVYAANNFGCCPRCGAPLIPFNACQVGEHGCQRIVINADYGGFTLSPKALKRLGELKGYDCYFFKTEGGFVNQKYIPISLEEAQRNLFVEAFTIPNPNEYLRRNKKWENMTSDEHQTFNEKYREISVNSRPDDRDDPLLVQVVEELGSDASGRFSVLKIIEIPDGIEWKIEEYDGAEWVSEKHHTWS
jgi:hypothetical protein